MHLLNFISQYPDEDNCKLKNQAIRDKEGVICRHCEGKEHYWKRDIWQLNVKHVKQGQPFVAILLWRVLNYLFVIGLLPCTYLHLLKKVFQPLNCKDSWGTNTVNPYGGCFTS
jgi:hypothetical protein